MTSIMRRTVRGTAAGLGALAIVAGTAACGGILGGGDEGDGDTGTEETQEEDGSSDSDSEDTDEGEDTGTEEDSSDAEESEDSGLSEETDDSAGDGADTEDGADDAGDTEEDGDDAAAGGELSEDDLTAVGDTYYEFLEAAAASDGEAACSLITNPDTDQPLKGGEVKLCAEGFEGGAEESGVDPSMMDAIDRSMVEAVDNGDGTAGVTLMGQDAGVTFVDVDGTWYIDGSQFV